jgi:hypothetical protein
MISPLRTPRERDCPRPMMFSVAVGALCSPTTTQILEVPISRPAMMLASSNIFPPGFQGFHFGCRVRCGAGHHPVHRHIIGHRQVQRAMVLPWRNPQIVNLPPARNCWSKLQNQSDFTALPRGDHDTPGAETSTPRKSTSPAIFEWSERGDQLQRVLHLRGLEAMPGCSLKIIQAQRSPAAAC